MELPQLEREYRVHVYETSPDEKLNLCSLFNYMQDIAAEHAIMLGYGRDELMKSGNFWVLSRIYSVIYEWPLRDETIIVKTWPFGTDSIFALRFFEIRFPDGRLIASASSSWLIINHETKKIQRPDETLTSYNSIKKSVSIPVRIPVKLIEAADGGSSSPEFRVKISDLDVNLHSNNVSYLKWTLDSYDLDFTMDHLPSSVEINYLAEAMYGENIVIKTSRDENALPSFRHSLIRSADKKELCRISFEWKEHKN